MNLFDAADRMESASIRLTQALDMLQIITDDMEENDPASEYGMTAFVTRRALYINCLAIFRRELEGTAAKPTRSNAVLRSSIASPRSLPTAWTSQQNSGASDMRDSETSRRRNIATSCEK